MKFKVGDKVLWRKHFGETGVVVESTEIGFIVKWSDNIKSFYESDLDHYEISLDPRFINEQKLKKALGI